MNIRKLLDAAVQQDIEVVLVTDDNEWGPAPIAELNLQSVKLKMGRQLYRIAIGQIRSVQFNVTECSL